MRERESFIYISSHLLYPSVISIIASLFNTNTHVHAHIHKSTHTHTYTKAHTRTHIHTHSRGVLSTSFTSVLNFLNYHSNLLNGNRIGREGECQNIFRIEMNGNSTNDSHIQDALLYKQKRYFHLHANFKLLYKSV